MEPVTSMQTLIHLPGVAGIDEAGRGPLAGPVVAAAVVLSKDFDCSGIADSKVLDPAAREFHAARIRAEALWSIAVAEHEEIDAFNILRATLRAMSRALFGLPLTPATALVDGNQIPPNLPCPCEAIVKGDGSHACIAAASILAKTERDAIMRRHAVTFPGYGFERHFGYSTPEHIRAIEELGPCEIHRKSFARFRISEQLCLTLEA